MLYQSVPVVTTYDPSADGFRSRHPANTYPSDHDLINLPPFNPFMCASTHVQIQTPCLSFVRKASALASVSSPPE